jgi:hypothetical protein
MGRPIRQLPAEDTLPRLLLTLTAVCGEYPSAHLKHLPGGGSYIESMVTALKQKGLLRTERPASDRYRKTAASE